jgi:flagellar hook-length control protein FliK
MTAPVTTPVTVARRAPGQDRTDPDGGAGFAQALDGALSRRGSVGSGPPEARPARREVPERAADRAADQAAEKSDRAADRAADHAADRAQRAAEKSDRAADRADRAADRRARAAVRAAGRADRADRADAKAEPGTTGPDETAEEPAVEPTDGGPGAAAGMDAAGRTGLPGAVWALLMGGAAAPVAEAAPPAVADAVALVGTTTGPPAAAPLPGAGLPSAAIAVPAAPAGSPVTASVAAAPVDGTAQPLPTVPGAAPVTAPGALRTAAAPTGEVASASTGVPAPSAFPVDGLTVVVAAEDTAVAPTPPTAAGAPSADGESRPETATPTIGGPAAALAGGSGDAGAPAGDDAGAGSAQASPAAPAADTAEPVATGLAAAPQVTSTAPTGSASASQDAAGSPQPVSTQVARQVAVLRHAPDGRHTMTLVLTPETLGPVEVQVTVSQGTLELSLRGAHEHGRAALVDALPDLRRDLQTAGLTCSRLEVDRDASGSWLAQQSAQHQSAQQQGSGQRPGSQDGGDARSRPWVRAADTGDGRPVPSTRSTSSGVDVRV